MLCETITKNDMKSLNYTKLGKLVQLCIEVSAGKVADAGFEYSGHAICDEIMVRIYVGGYRNRGGWFQSVIESDSDIEKVTRDLQNILGNGKMPELKATYREVTF